MRAIRHEFVWMNTPMGDHGTQVKRAPTAADGDSTAANTSPYHRRHHPSMSPSIGHGRKAARHEERKHAAPATDEPPSYSIA